MAKFGILITTYYRKTGVSRFYLKRSLNSVLNQTSHDWHLYLIGDHYVPETEFFDISKVIPTEKATVINLSRSPERESLSGMDLWGSAGMTAQNLGLRLLRKRCQVMCRLDDDDYWLPNHLDLLSKNYQPNTAFAYTRAKHVNGFLPKETHHLRQNNLPPKPYNLIHSAASWRTGMIGIDYRSPAGTGLVAADAVMWNDISEICRRKGYDTVYVPETTVIHDEEGRNRKKVVVW